MRLIDRLNGAFATSPGPQLLSDEVYLVLDGRWAGRRARLVSGYMDIAMPGCAGDLVYEYLYVLEGEDILRGGFPGQLQVTE